MEELTRMKDDFHGYLGQELDRSSVKRMKSAAQRMHARNTVPAAGSAAGHASLLTTSVYLHVAVDDDGELGSLFEFGR